jgi:acyl-coenzyme A thioesterase PaaI-like protein
MNGSVHGGALATILDCATTIAILRGDRNLSRTVRYSKLYVVLNWDYHSLVQPN